MNKRSKKMLCITAGILAVAVIITIAVLFTSGSGSRNDQKHMDLAQHYMDELQYEQAVAEYQAAIAAEPDNTEAYQALAEIYTAMGDYESALDVLDRGVAQTDSKELEIYKDGILEMVDSSMDAGQDTGLSGSNTGVSESGEDHSASEDGGSVLPEVTEEADIAEESGTPVKEQQDADSTVTILITWDGTYEDGSLMELDVYLTGKMEDGTELLYDEDLQAFVATDGALAAEVETSVSETQGNTLITLYRTDGFYNLEVSDGIGYVLHNTNGLSDSEVSITMVDAEGKSTQVSVEDEMYRSYTGLWFFGIGIDHGMLTDYDSSWME